MKPSFALTLAQDSIGLLHRTPSGWLVLGTVQFDDPALTETMAELRATALGLEPQGLATKLVIPNSEILYDSLRAPGPKAAERRAQIGAALEGRTPYGLEDLVYDWSGTGEEVQVAVVARDTLAQAEAFATEHGFNPVSFVAIPDPGGFGAEPWFGLTEAAPGILAKGEKVSRDQDPIRIIQRAGRGSTRAAALAEPAADPESVTEAAAAVDDITETAVTEAAVPLSPPETETETEITALPEPEAAAETVVEDPAAVEAPSAVEALPAVEEAGPPPGETQAEAEVSAPLEPAAAESVAEIPPEPIPAFDAIPEPFWRKPDGVAQAALPEAAAAEAVTADETVEPRPAEAAADPRAVSPAEVASPAPELGTKDDGLTLDWPEESAAIDATKAALAASLAPAPDPVQAALVAGLRREIPFEDDDIPPMPGALRGAAGLRARGAGAADVSPAARPLSEKVQKALGKAAKGKAKRPAERPALAPPPPPLPVASGKPRVPQPASEAEAMTVFGQRNTPRVGGKPRYLGLALTGLLLVLLLLVAVWAANFLEPQVRSRLGDAPDAAPQATLTPTADPADDAAQTAAENDPALFIDEGLPIATGPGTPEAEPAEAAPQPLEAGPAPAPMVTGLTPASAPGEGDGGAARALSHRPVEELTLPLPDATLDTSPRAQLAGVSASNADLAPGASPVLQEFGALYQFDDQGRILPTPDGVVTPDGVRLVAARPANIPPPRPARAAPAEPQPDPAPVAIDPQPAPAPAVAALPPAPAAAMPPQVATGPGSIVILPAPAVVQPGADGDLAVFRPDASVPANRPRLRPGEAAPTAVIPPATGAADEEGALPPVEAAPANSFASRRPPQRPAAVTRAAEAEQARQLAAAAAAAAAAASAQQANAALALAPTRRPAARPANFARRVETTLAAAAVAQPRVAAAAAPTAIRRGTPEIDDDGEPEVTRAAPPIPTRASVARQATVSGALNLGRLNLIGVFGTANSRHALVRESGGRLVRVKIGDRLDGGRVTAISASELSYQKGNNTLRLQMPRS